MEARPDVDVAVAGAGPAGVAAALFAAREGLRVAIFDRAAFPRDKPCGEGLMPSGRRLLAELGVEDAMRASGAPSLRGIVFGVLGRSPAAVPFPAHMAGDLGFGVRRLSFDAMLVDRLRADPRIAFHAETPVDRVICGNGAPSIRSPVGDLRARFVVLADGLRSPLRHQLGWTVGPRPPHRYGIVGHWKTEGPTDPWVRITVDDGFEVYDGPVAGGERLVALLCHRRRMRAFAGDLRRRYREAVMAARPQLARAEMSGEVAAVGPFRYGATTVARDRIFLVGDASGFVDPISGEGLAAGLAQARALARSLSHPDPESAYRRTHRLLTRDPRRVARLLLFFTRTPARTARGMQGLKRAPAAMGKMLGVNFGYWGFDRITPREWLALFTGR